MELGYLYYNMTTQWGRPVRLPEESPALSRIVREGGRTRVGGILDNLPVSAGLGTASPYFGLAMPEPNAFMKAMSQPGGPEAASLRARWLRRYGVTHRVTDAPRDGDPLPGASILFEGRDPALDSLAYRAPQVRIPRLWRVERSAAAFPEVRVALRREVAADRQALLEKLTYSDELTTSWCSAEEARGLAGSPNAARGRVVSWDGRAAVVEHDGPVDVVVTRTAYPGWTFRIDDQPAGPIYRVDGGLMAAFVPGAGRHRVTFAYEPTSFPTYTAASLMMCGAGMLLVASRFARRKA